MAETSDSILSALQQYWQDITNFVQNVATITYELTGAVLEEVEDSIAQLYSMLQALLNAIEQFAVNEAEQIAQQIGNVVSQIQSLLNSVGISVNVA